MTRDANGLFTSSRGVEPELGHVSADRQSVRRGRRKHHELGVDDHGERSNRRRASRRPKNGASFPRKATIPIAAAATEWDGSVTKVEFFRGTDEAGRGRNALHTPTVGKTSRPAATSLTVRATDNKGAVKTSAPVSASQSGGDPARPISIACVEVGWIFFFFFFFFFFFLQVARLETQTAMRFRAALAAALLSADGCSLTAANGASTVIEAESTTWTPSSPCRDRAGCEREWRPLRRSLGEQHGLDDGHDAICDAARLACQGPPVPGRPASSRQGRRRDRSRGGRDRHRLDGLRRTRRDRRRRARDRRSVHERSRDARSVRPQPVLGRDDLHRPGLHQKGRRRPHPRRKPLQIHRLQPVHDGRTLRVRARLGAGPRGLGPGEARPSNVVLPGEHGQRRHEGLVEIRCHAHRGEGAEHQGDPGPARRLGRTARADAER